MTFYCATHFRVTGLMKFLLHSFYSKQKFPSSCCGFQSGNERVFHSFLPSLSLAVSLYVHRFLVLTLVQLFQVFPVFSIHVENRKSILFSALRIKLLLFSFISLLFVHFQVIYVITEIISDGCSRERTKLMEN